MSWSEFELLLDQVEADAALLRSVNDCPLCQES